MIEDRGDLGVAALHERTDELVQKLKEHPALTGVSTQIRSKTPQLFLDIDRAKVAALGISLNDVNQTLDMYMGSLYVNSFNDFGRHWQVTIQADGPYRNRAEDLNRFQVRNKSGEMVPLGTLVNVREIGGPIAITRYNLYDSSNIRGIVRPGYSDGEAIKEIDRMACETLPHLHETGLDRVDVPPETSGQHAPRTYSCCRSFASSWPCRRCTRVGAAPGRHFGGAVVSVVFGGRRALVPTAMSTFSCKSAWSCWSAWRARTPSSWSSTPSN